MQQNRNPDTIEGICFQHAGISLHPQIEFPSVERSRSEPSTSYLGSSNSIFELCSSPQGASEKSHLGRLLVRRPVAAVALLPQPLVLFSAGACAGALGKQLLCHEVIEVPFVLFILTSASWALFSALHIIHGLQQPGSVVSANAMRQEACLTDCICTRHVCIASVAPDASIKRKVDLGLFKRILQKSICIKFLQI